MRGNSFGAWAAVVGIAALLAAAPGRADPQGAKPEPVTDLKVFQESVAKAVEKGEWSAANDEVAREAVIALFDRANKAAGRKADLPVDFKKLEKVPVAKDWVANPEGILVVGENVQGTSATGSVIFASGDVKFTSIKNCVVVAKNVRFTAVQNSVIVATELLRGTGAGSKNTPDTSLLVAGQWLRLTSVTGVVCHVARPGNDPPPDEKFRFPTETAIRFTVATDVTFLNADADWTSNGKTNCKSIELKTPLVK